jgi:D-glycero-D-manno-heptose 1,7-bisphosphate phosphatase
MKHSALFLDRDGVINERLVDDYVRDWSQFAFCEGVPFALGVLRPYFERIVVVTNQQGIGKGLMSEADLDEIHTKMMAELEEVGCKIDGIYYCPHLASAGCDCRKPATGLALQAQRDFPEIDFSDSFLVGDSESDLLLAKALDLFSIWISPDFDDLNLADLCDDMYGSLLEWTQDFLENEVENLYEQGETQRRAFAQAAKADLQKKGVIAISRAPYRNQELHNMCARLISTYADLWKLGAVLPAKTLYPLKNSEIEPDLLFFNREHSAEFEEEQRGFPAPDLIIEFLPLLLDDHSRLSRKKDYARFGVSEIWSFDYSEHVIYQHLLQREGSSTFYESTRLEIGDDLVSTAIDDFSAPVAAFFDLNENLKALQRILKVG